MIRDDQLGLFRAERAPIEPVVTEEDRELAARLPSFVRFGTSSWSFAGWAGVLFRGKPSDADLARGGLVAYAQHPLFRAVGIDRTLYRPLRDDDLAGYLEQLAVARALAPDLAPFRAVSKVWDEITTAVYPSHPRYGAKGGTRNPSFLDARVLQSEVLAPYQRASATGPFVFEITPIPPGTFTPEAFVARVEAFLEALPGGPRWAFELRNADLFGARWLDMLRAHDAAHVYNYWTAMPSLRMQLRAGGGRPTARFMVLRLMQPPYSKYEDLKTSWSPFDRLRASQPEMRADVQTLLEAARGHGVRDAFVLVGNKCEGCAPETVRALARMTVRTFALS